MCVLRWGGGAAIPRLGAEQEEAGRWGQIWATAPVLLAFVGRWLVLAQSLLSCHSPESVWRTFSAEEDCCIFHHHMDEAFSVKIFKDMLERSESEDEAIAEDKQDKIEEEIRGVEN